jgi:hypothetical protein
MKNIPRKFFKGAEPSYDPNVFFTNMLSKVKGKEGVSRLSPENFADIINDQDRYNNKVEPEEVLDFDSSLFPDNLNIGFEFKNRRLHGFVVSLFLHRVGNDIHWSLWLGLYDDFFSYPFNPSRIENDLHLQLAKFGLLCEPWEQDIDDFSMHVEAVLPVNGNMLEQFNNMWKHVESIYKDSVKKIVAEVKAGY